MSHLFTLFDMGARVFGVDSGGFSGDTYMVTAGLVAQSQASLTDAARYALWQQALEETAVLPLRSAITVGTAQAGLIGSQQMRYHVTGPAVSEAFALVSRGSAGEVRASPAVADRLDRRFGRKRANDGSVLISNGGGSSRSQLQISANDDECAGTIATGNATVVVDSPQDRPEQSLATPLLAIVSTDDHIPVNINAGVFTSDTLETAFTEYMDASLRERGYLGAAALIAVSVYHCAHLCQCIWHPLLRCCRREMSIAPSTVCVRPTR